MKIICIGRNYAEHAKELKNEVPDKPVIFLKPDTALIKDNKPFYLPDWATNMQYELEVVYKIGKNGKYIDEQFAHKYISEVTVGIDFTERALQTELKNKGLPWELSKGFDGSAITGNFIKIEDLNNKDNIAFHLLKNQELVQEGHSGQMIFSISKILSFVSKYYTLKTGDLIFTGTPAGVGPVAVGDVLTGFLDGVEMLSFKVK